MKKIALVMTGVLALTACNRDTDETASSSPSRLSDEQRAGYSIEQVRTGMPKAQALAAISRSFPGYQVVADPAAIYARSENDSIEVGLSGYDDDARVVQITRKRDFPNGARQDSIMQTLTAKFGRLVEPLPYTVTIVGEGTKTRTPQGFFFAGEGVTDDGIVLRRCLARESFSFRSYPSEDCGLMASAVFDSLPVARSVTVVVVDWRLKAQLSRAGIERSRSQANEATQQELDSAQAVNSF